jgi:flagellin-like protein
MPAAQSSECDEDRAVSPVIGVILMVAITVILAAVIGTFAFGLFDRDSNPAPSVVFETDYERSADELTITHDSGNSFESANVEFKISGGDGSATVSNSWPTEVNSGNSVTLSGVGSDETVRVIWQDPREQDISSVLFEWSGPEV